MSAFRIARPTRRHGDETGFSLIELMIVLLIIAILLAVAIPTYLAAVTGPRTGPPRRCSPMPTLSR